MGEGQLAIGRTIERTRKSTGERDRVVDIEQLVERKGSSGLPIEEWEPLAVGEWMSKVDTDAREDYKSAQLSGPLRTAFEGVYREDMDPELVDVVKRRRFIMDGRIYDITGATQIGRRAGIEYLTLARLG